MIKEELKKEAEEYIKNKQKPIGKYDLVAFTEKHIAELEKENAKLEKLRCCENCKNVNLQLHWRDNKEINEQRMFKCGNCRNRVNWEFGGKTIGISETQQLTHAKELLKKFKSEYEKDGHFYAWFENCMAEAEQFLKDSEPQSKWVNPARTTNDNEIKINSEVEK